MTCKNFASRLFWWKWNLTKKLSEFEIQAKNLLLEQFCKHFCKGLKFCIFFRYSYKLLFNKLKKKFNHGVLFKWFNEKTFSKVALGRHPSSLWHLPQTKSGRFGFQRITEGEFQIPQIQKSFLPLNFTWNQIQQNLNVGNFLNLSFVR